jgi:hypothetical protein
VDVYFRELAPENWSRSGSNIVASQLESSVSPIKSYCFLNPTTLQNLGGTKGNTLPPATIFSSSLMSNSLHTALTAADFSYANWMAKGWELDSLEIFKSQLKTWLTNNFPPFSVLNPNNSLNAYILDKTISGTRYIIPLLYVGDQGSLIQTITANISVNYATPIYSGSDFEISGTVLDNFNPVQNVSVSLTLAGQTQTVTSGVSGDFTAYFTGIETAGVYTLNWTANINGTALSKSRQFTITAIQAQSVDVTTTPSTPTNGITFTATANVKGNTNNNLNNAPITLTYNGEAVSGFTDSSGNFSASFIAASGATSILYDAVTVSGSKAITIATLQTVSISTTPPTPIDTQSFAVNATVRNSINALVENALASLTYEGVSISGYTNGSGVFSASFTAIYSKETVGYNVQSGVLTGSSTITVGKTTSKLTNITIGSPTPNPVITQDPFDVVVTAFDQYSVGLPSASIQIKTGSTVLGTGITLANGSATISSLAPASSGSYSIYAASGVISSTAQVLTVDAPAPVATYLTISELDPPELFAGNTFFVTIGVLSQYNEPLLEALTITITDGTNILGSGTTNPSTGLVTVLCSAPPSAGVYSVYATYSTITSDTKTLTVS